jgi:hypothetical protein
VLKRLALGHHRLNLAVDRLRRRLRGERPFRLAGACRRSGCCCEAPAIHTGSAVWYLPTLRRLFLAWQRHVNGFHLVRRERPRTFVFRCTHFDPVSRSCDSYDSRPGMCRDYPRPLLWQPRPELFPRCGFRAVHPDAGRFLAALGRLELSREQEAALRKGLQLD